MTRSLAYIVTAFIVGCSSPAPTKKAISTTAPIAAQMAEPSSSDSATLHSLLSDKLCQAETLNVGCFENGRILRITKRLPTHPIVYYFYAAPSGSAFNLTGAPRQLQAAAKMDGLSITSPEAAKCYLNLYFEACKTRSTYLVHGIEDFRFLPSMDAAQEARKAAIINRWQDELQAPTVSIASPGFDMTCYFVQDRSLFRAQIHVLPDGTLTENATELEQDLPIVWIR